MNTFEALELIDEIRRAGHVLTAKQAQGLEQVQKLLRGRLLAGRPRIYANDLEKWRHYNAKRKAKAETGKKEPEA